MIAASVRTAPRRNQSEPPRPVKSRWRAGSSAAGNDSVCSPVAALLSPIGVVRIVRSRRTDRMSVSATHVGAGSAVRLRTWRGSGFRDRRLTWAARDRRVGLRQPAGRGWTRSGFRAGSCSRASASPVLRHGPHQSSAARGHPPRSTGAPTNARASTARVLRGGTVAHAPEAATPHVGRAAATSATARTASCDSATREVASAPRTSFALRRARAHRTTTAKRNVSETSASPPTGALDATTSPGSAAPGAARGLPARPPPSSDADWVGRRWSGRSGQPARGTIRNQHI